MSLAMLWASVLSPWGLLQALALVAGAALWWRGRATEGASSWSLYVAGMVGAALGAVGLGVLLRLPRLLWSGHHRGWEVMAFGALFGMALGVAVASRRRGRDPATSLDRLAPALGGMVAVARLGCWFAGCDFGAMTSLPWATRFGVGSPAWHQHQRLGAIAETAMHSAPVHPTQLYEVALGLVMIAVAHRVPRSARRGSAFMAVMATYAVGRGLVEVLRADEGRGFVGPLSTPQWLAIAVLMGVVSWWLNDRRGVNVVSRQGSRGFAPSLRSEEDNSAKPRGRGAGTRLAKRQAS